MKQITIKVPDNQYDFFLELMKNLGFNKEKSDEFVLTSAHKKILDQRLKQMEADPSGETNWNSVKKRLNARLQKDK